jgi:hypothetical protein
MRALVTIFFGAAVLWVIISLSAWAQSGPTTGNPYVVTNCGTIPASVGGTYPVGTYRPMTINTEGQLCGF